MKKMLSLALALVLVLSLGAGAFAATFPVTDTSITVTVDGQTLYLDTTVYSLVLPTSTALSFNLDPQGLINAKDGDKVSDLTGGAVIGGAPAYFVNNSSVPVKLTAELTGTTAAGKDKTSPDPVDTATATFVTTDDAFSGTTNSIRLVVTPSTTNVNSKVVENNTVIEETAFTAAAKGFAVSTTATKLEFALPAADYIVKYVGTSAEDKLNASKYSVEMVAATGKGNGLSIGGAINPGADWSVFTSGDHVATASKVGLSAVFTFAADTTAYVSDPTDANYSYDKAVGAAHLLKDALSPTHKVVASPEKAAEPTVVADADFSSVKSLSHIMSVGDLGSTGVSFKIPGVTELTSIKATNFGNLDVSADTTYDSETGLFTFKKTLAATTTAANLEIVAGGETYTLALTFYNVELEADGAAGEYTATVAHIGSTGVIMLLSDKPESITSAIATNFGDADMMSGMTYDKTTGLLTFKRSLAESTTLANLKIVAGGATYLLDITFN